VKYAKRVLANMEKAYAIGMFAGADRDSFLIGVEKHGPIRRFSLDGEFIEDVADGPGGVMTIAQVPGRGDQFLATYQFFSPNCGGDDAKIVSYTRDERGAWACRTVCDLPYVHRFGLLEGADGSTWLLACTIKSACEYKEDWRFPGKVYAARIDEPFETYDEHNQLSLEVVADTQLKNHGFWVAPNRGFALISTDSCVCRYTPPAASGVSWGCERLIDEPTSDMCLVDFDGDGRDEMLTLSPFHGDTLSIYHLDDDGRYQLAWRDPEKRDFWHAIWSGELAGVPCAIIGNRKGGRDLYRVAFEQGAYRLEVIDHDRGPANCWVYRFGGADHVIATNRETDEVALYSVEP